MIYPRSPRAKWFPVTRLGTICVDNRMHAYASQAAPSSSISSLDDTGSLQNGGYFPNPRCSRRVIPSTAMILSVATLCPVAVNQRGLIHPSSKYFAFFFLFWLSDKRFPSSYSFISLTSPTESFSQKHTSRNLLIERTLSFSSPVTVVSLLSFESIYTLHTKFSDKSSSPHHTAMTLTSYSDNNMMMTGMDGSNTRPEYLEQDFSGPAAFNTSSMFQGRLRRSWRTSLDWKFNRLDTLLPRARLFCSQLHRRSIRNPGQQPLRWRWRHAHWFRL